MNIAQVRYLGRLISSNSANPLPACGLNTQLLLLVLNACCIKHLPCPNAELLPTCIPTRSHLSPITRIAFQICTRLLHLVPAPWCVVKSTAACIYWWGPRCLCQTFWWRALSDADTRSWSYVFNLVQSGEIAFSKATQRTSNCFQ